MMFQFDAPTVSVETRYVVDPDSTIRFNGLVGCSQIELFVDLCAKVRYNRVSKSCLQRCFGSGYMELINDYGFVNLYIDFGQHPKQSVAVSCKVTVQGKDVVLGEYFCHNHIASWRNGYVTIQGRNVGPGT